MSKDLGDHLHQMANANHDGSDADHTPPSSQAQPVAHETGFAASAIRAPLQDQNLTFAGQQPAYRPAPRASAGSRRSSDFKAIAAPILMTVGLMLLLPAFWAVLVLTGAGVPMSDRDDASTMAKVMLLCWPLALSLIIPAILIFARLAADRKKNSAA
jgi:hypothetical protein